MGRYTPDTDPSAELQSRSYLQQGTEESPIVGRYGGLGPGGGTRAGQPGGKDQGIFDVTGGAFEYGLADTAQLLFKNVGSTIGSDYIQGVAKDLQSFKDEHPEYAPTEVRGIFDLVTNPAAISSRVFGAAPYLLATLGATALPGGFPLSMALVYGIESQRSYDQAIQDGASEGEANTAARISGVVNSLLQSQKVAGLLSFGRGGAQAIAGKAVEDAAKLVRATGATGDAISFVAKQALIGALQGSTSDLIPLGVYAKPVEGGVSAFVDRRLQDAFGAITTSLVFGPAEKAFNSVVKQDGKLAPTPEDSGISKVVDSFDKGSLTKALVETRGLQPSDAEKISTLVDAQARKWAVDNSSSKEEFYSSNEYVKKLAGSEKSVIPQDPKNVGEPTEGQTPPNSVSEKVLETGQAIVSGLKVDLSGKPDKVVYENNPNLPDWVNQEMITQGKNPSRTLNDIDAGYEAFQKNLENDPVTKFLSDINPQLAARAKIGDLSPKEYQSVRETMKEMANLYPKPSKVNFTPPKSDPDAVKNVLKDLQGVFFSSLPQDKLELLQKMYSGRGKVSEEEQLAGAFAKYLQGGNAPSSELVETFKGFKDWISETYKSVRDQGLGVKLKPEVVQLFDSVLMEPTPTVNFLNQKVQYLDGRVQELQKAKKGSLQVGPIDDSIKTAKDDLKGVQVELQNLKEAQFIPRAKTEVENAAERIQNKLKNEPPIQREYRTRAQTIMDNGGKVVSLETPLKRYDNGKEALEGLDNFHARAKLHVGKWEDRIVEDAFSNLSSQDKKWINTTDASGTTNLQRAYDTPTKGSYAGPGGTGIDPSTLSPGIQKYAKLLFDINRYSAGVAKEVGVQQTRSDGSVVPFEQPDGQRVPRILTMEAKKAVIEKSGQIWEALKSWVSTHNGVTLKGAEDLLVGDFGVSSLKRSSSLEFTRKIKNLPAVLDVNGTQVAIQYTEPLELARRSLEYQTRRAEFIREFGQGTLLNVGKGKLRELGNILGADYKVTKDKLRSALEEKLGDIDPGMSTTDLQELAKNSGVDLKWSNQDFIDHAFDTPFTQLDKSGESKLRTFAKGLKGVALDEVGPDGARVPRPLVDVFNDVKTRLITPVDNKLERLANGYVAEGGNIKDFQDVMTVAQGLPFHQLGRSEPEQLLKLGSQVIGSLQTSMAAIPNLTQVLTQLPQLGGMKNTLLAIDKYMKDKHTVMSDVVALTGIHRSVFVTQAEPGYQMSNTGRVLKEVVGRVTFQDQINDFNRGVAGQVGIYKAEEWNKGNFSQRDTYTAKFLGLNDGEISQLLARSGMSDTTYAKVVQNMIGRSQFNSDASYKKGLVENIPVLQMLLSYSSYLFGTTRANLGLLKDIGTAVKSKDLAGISSGAQRLSYLMVGMLGAGMTSQILRAAVKGKGSDEVKSLDAPLMDQTLSALHEVGGLGIIQRFSDAFKYDGGVAERTALGIVPQVGALVKFMGVLAGYGRFGEFPLSERIYEELKRQTPVFGSASNWFDEIAWPDKKEYDIVRGDLTEWRKKNLTTPPGGSFDDPMRPDYWQVFNHVARNDSDGALEEVRKFYQSLGGKGKDPEVEIRGLRQSLIGRSPVNLSDPQELLFLTSLSPEKRVATLKAQVKYQSLVDLVAPKLGA